MLNDNSLSKEELQQFQELGFVGPFKLIEAHNVDTLTKKLKEAQAQAFIWKRILAKVARIAKIQDHQVSSFVWGKAKWGKGLHVTIPKLYRLSTNPVILDKVSSILGENILQWSAQILTKKENNYPWHGDVETIEWEGATVWLALTNVSKQTPMKIITRSHSLPNYTYPQELIINSGLDGLDDDAVLAAAQKLDPKCELVSMEINPGEFFIFSGRLWHVPKNYSSVERTVMITQYSPTSEKIRMPLNFDPPIAWKSSPPPCLLVKGKNEYDHNLIVLPPK